MKSIFFKISILILIITCLFSCGNKIGQNSMFTGRNHQAKNRGIYDAGMNRKQILKKPMSVQTKKEYDKLSKHDTNPKKAAKKAQKEIDKKKRASAKARAKNNRKRHVKTKTTKGRPAGSSGDK